MSDTIYQLSSGLPDFTQRISALMSTGRFVSSYIFAGVNGFLKERAARYLCAALNCSQSDDGPCGQCSVCRSIDQTQYYGYDTLAGESGDPGASIKIETIREIRDNVRCRRPEGWFVIHIPQAQRLTLNAANSLLKIIEEAPDRVMFIFSVPSPGLLIPTIRSRSQVLFIGSQPGSEDEQDEQILFSNITVDNYLQFIENNTIGAQLIEIEKSKVDRQALKRALNALLQRLSESSNKALYGKMDTVMKHIRYLDRPVNPQTSLYLLSRALKGE